MASGSITRPKRFKGLLRIGEAAELLEVSSETLRNWDKWGWLSPVRNPVTGYRYYKYDVLVKFRDELIADREAAN